MFGAEGVESLVHSHDADNGPDNSFFNSIYRLQETIYRFKKKDAIVFAVQTFDDRIRSGKLTLSDLSVDKLKSGPRSTSDPVYVSFMLRGYLLGEWLNGRDYPLYIKDKLRSVFASHASWRSQYSPMDSSTAVDTSFLIGWPKYGKEFMNFYENMIYEPTPGDDHAFRTCAKNNTTLPELLAQKPYCEIIRDITLQARSSDSTVPTQPGDDTPPAPSAPAPPTSQTATPPSVEQRSIQLATKLLEQSSSLGSSGIRLQNQQSAFINEVASFDGMKQAFEVTPLALVKPGPETGNLLVLMDCNCWGETDSQPHRRATPMSKEKFDIPMRALLAARYGTDEPTALQKGEFWMCIDGGKDRKRHFVKVLKHPKMQKGRERKRLIHRKTMLHVTERSWRARRSRQHGSAKLSQNIHLVASYPTFAAVPHVQFKTITGSTRCDVIGPVDLPPRSSIPTMLYYGKHYILAGGKADDSSDDVSESDAEELADDASKSEAQPAPSETKPPVSLPIVLLQNFIETYNIKHVIDLAPTPLRLPFTALQLGCTYVGVTATPMMQTELKTRLYNDLIVAMVTPSEKYLYDPRYKQDGIDAGVNLFIK